MVCLSKSFEEKEGGEMKITDKEIERLKHVWLDAEEALSAVAAWTALSAVAAWDAEEAWKAYQKALKKKKRGF